MSMMSSHQAAALIVLLSAGHSLRRNATRNCSSGVFFFFSFSFLPPLCPNQRVGLWNLFPLNPPLSEGEKAASCPFVQLAD